MGLHLDLDRLFAPDLVGLAILRLRSGPEPVQLARIDAGLLRDLGNLGRLDADAARGQGGDQMEGISQFGGRRIHRFRQFEDRHRVLCGR